MNDITLKACEVLDGASERDSCTSEASSANNAALSICNNDVPDLLVVLINDIDE